MWEWDLEKLGSWCFWQIGCGTLVLVLGMCLCCSICYLVLDELDLDCIPDCLVGPTISSQFECDLDKILERERERTSFDSEL